MNKTDIQGVFYEVSSNFSNNALCAPRDSPDHERRTLSDSMNGCPSHSTSNSQTFGHPNNRWAIF